MYYTIPTRVVSIGPYDFPNLCHSREYMDISWGCGWFLATLFVVTNLIGQLGAVAMVLTRWRFLEGFAFF